MFVATTLIHPFLAVKPSFQPGFVLVPSSSLPHEAAVALDIGAQDGGKLPFNFLNGHGVSSS